MVLTLASCAAVPAAPPNAGDDERQYLVNFSNSNLEFIRSYEASPDAAHTAFYIAAADTGDPTDNAVYITPGGDGTMYISVDLSSLLGENVADLRALEADIAVVNDYADFYAVSGEIAALDAEGVTVAEGVWSVYMAEKNPNLLRLELSDALQPHPYNMLIISKTVDNAVVAGLKQSGLLITELRFYDADGRLLPVNADASFNAPDGFGEPDRSTVSGLGE